MSNETNDRRAQGRKDWQHALDIISRLATAHDAIERDMASAGRDPSRKLTVNETSLVPLQRPTTISSSNAQLLSDIDEIAEATRKLRLAEPSLTMAWPVNKMQARSATSVWIMIVLIWTTVTLMIVGALFAITLVA